MKVLFLANIPSPYRVEFFNRLSKKCDLTVVYERKNASDRENDWYISHNTNYRVLFLRGLNYSNDSSIAPGVLRFLNRAKFDVFVVSGYSSVTQMLEIIALKLRRIPYILTVDGGMIRPDNAIKYSLKKSLVSGAEAYQSSGKICDEYLVHYGADPKRLNRYHFTSVLEKDILNTILTAPEKSRYKEKIGCTAEKMILTVGQPIHRKGFDVLVRAMQCLNDSDVQCFIIGGVNNEECQRLIDEYHLKNIVMLPFMKKDRLSDYYKAADLFVLPTREDIWGLVINEAMSFGLPVITTDKCNAGLELVKEAENGHIVPVEDYKLLADTMDRVLKDDVLLQYAVKSLEIIKEYSIENMVAEYAKAFNDVFANQKG